MRVISGKHRGKKIETLKTKELRPTTGRAKEAVFNMLSHGKFSGILDGAKVLDLFCGCGALSVESLSHGAERVILVDKNPDHLEIARRNIATLNESDHAVFLRADSSYPPPAQFPCDVIFMDPPYHKDFVSVTLKNLENTGWLTEQTVIVLETEKKSKDSIPENYQIIEDRVYGASRIRMLQWRAPQ